MEGKSNFTFDLPALRVLENEHKLLTYLMNQWHPIALGFEQGKYKTEQDAADAFIILREKIKDFIEPLKNHTDKEEEFLFPALAKYVGNEQGPVLATEEEHAEIDAYIGHFLHHSRRDITVFTMGDFREIAQDACEAFEVITFHFIKEESVIFPMVESILQPNEQYDLLENMYTSII